MEKIQYQQAQASEKEAIQDLLMACELPGEDIGEHLTHFILAKDGKTLIGTIGLEVYDDIALLRSLAVNPNYRGKGIGQALYARIMDYAQSHTIREIYLLTLTAEEFFAKRGFEIANRQDLPPAIKATKEFRGLCPDTAVSMGRKV